MTTPATIAVEIQKLAPSAIIELFELDGTSFGGELMRFHAGTNQLSQNIVWQGATYTAFPLQATGFDYSGNGQLPRPKIVVSNVAGSITLLVLTYDDLLGAKVTRKRTLLKYLDAVNFPGGVNPTADADAAFESDIFFIDRKVTESRDLVEFELAAAFDVAGVVLPRRQIIQNVCTWKYRGTECGWAGKTSAQNGSYTISAAGVGGLGPVRTVTLTMTAHGYAVDNFFQFRPSTGGGIEQQMVVNSVTTNTITTTTALQTATTSGNCYISQIYDADDASVLVSASDVCGKRISSCKVRFGEIAPLPFGSFPAAGLAR